MPSMKKAAKEEFDWSGFPPVPPEAECWKPDPDSIAKPGAFKDPRFNKDPFEESRLRAARKQVGYHIHHSSEAARALSPASLSQDTPAGCLSVRDRPPQVVRGDFAQQNLPTSEQSKPGGGAVQSLANNGLDGAPVISESTRTGSTTAASTFSLVGAPPPGTDNMPAWAGPLERALAEDTSRVQPQIGQVVKKSVPPHLRGKEAHVTKGHKNAPQQQGRVVKSSSSSREPTKSQYEEVCEATRRMSSAIALKTEDWRNESCISNEENASFNRPRTGAELNGKFQVVQSQSIAVSKAGSEQSSASGHNVSLASSDGYIDQGHYLKISLVLAMERQLLENELQKLSSQELDDRILKTSSIHETFWQAKNGNGKAASDGLSNGSPVTGLGQVSSTPITSGNTNSMR